MSLALLYFIITGIPAIKTTLMIFAAAVSSCVFCLGIRYISALDYDRHDLAKELAGKIRFTGIIAAILFSSVAFVPSTKDIMLITGGAYLTNNKEIMSLPENGARAVNKFLQEYFEKEESDNETDKSNI